MNRRSFAEGLKAQTPPAAQSLASTKAASIDAAMLRDKQIDGYWLRAQASALAAQIQSNGRDL